jgi:transglutaminase-like putative cysteine protease
MTPSDLDSRDVGTRAARRGPSARTARIARAQWPLAFALLLLLVVANAGLGPLLEDTGWWWLMTFVAAGVLLGSAGLRRAGLPVSLGPLAGFGVLVLMLTLLFGAGSGWLWLIPTGETIDRFRDLVLSGTVSIEQQSTPAEATAGILFLLSAGAGVIAILIDTLAVILRVTALAGLPVLVPLLVPGGALGGEANLQALVLTAVAYLLLLHVEIRMRRAGSRAGPPAAAGPGTVAPARRRVPGALGGAAVVGSVAIVAAIVVSVATPVLPGGNLTGARPGSSLLFANGVSPMINLGQDLRRPDAEPVLHYRTTATRPPYLRLLTLDEFSGRNWTAALAPGSRANSVDDIDLPPGLSPDITTSETITTIGIDNLATRWLPAPAPARSVTGLLGAWYWNESTGSIASPGDTTRGQEYTVTALTLEPTAEQLRQAAGDYPEEIRRSLTLPPETPTLIGDTAREVTAGTATAYDAARALQDYLRGSEFSYDIEAPVEDGYDGGGMDVVSTFLEVKSGYCVHFSSAMAAMARSIGIPARIAIGYQPGTLSASSSIAGIGRYSVDTHDLHAWTEVYFEGVGWVPFEPTPGRGAVPAYTRDDAAAVQLGEAGQAAPTNAPRPEDLGGQNDTDTQADASSPADPRGGILRLGLLLLGTLALLLLPAAVRVNRRMLRRRGILAGRSGAAEAWREVSDTAVDHGVFVRETETPRELAGRLRVLVGSEGGAAGSGAGGGAPAEALDRLLVGAERSRFGRPGGDVPTATGAQAALLLADLDLVLRGIHSGSDWRLRARATLLPASLWRPGERRTDYPAANA